MENLEVAHSEILKTMPIGAIVVEKKSGKIIFVNDRFIELLGFNPKGSSFKEYALNMARARKLEGGPYLFEQLPLTKALLYGDVTNNQEIVLQKPDKTDRTIRVNAKRLSNNKGEIIGAIATFEDITERNKAEEALKVSEERFRNVFNKSALGIAIGDMQGRVVESNFALENILGYSKEELKCKAFSEFTHPDDVNIEWSLIKEVLAGKRDYYEIEKRYIRKDGKTIWVHLTGNLIVDSNKKPLIGVATIEDITHRKQAEEALKESEERFSKAFDTSPAAMGISRLADGLLTDVNKAFLQLFEFSREEVIGHTSNELGSFAYPNERAELASLLQQKGKIQNLEMPFRTKTGKPIREIVSISEITYKNQAYLVSTLVDITERKKAEEALKESEQLYRTLFDNTEDGFQLFKPLYDEAGKPCDLRVLKVNKAYERQTGLKESDIVGRTVKEFIPNIEPYWISTYGNVAKTGKSTHIENYNQSTNRWYDVYAFLYRKDQVGALFRDITERKKAEETLRESEKKYHELYESFDEAFIATDWEFNVIHWNKAAERVTTVPATVAVGKKVYEVLPEMLTIDVTPYFEALKEKKAARFMMNVVSRETKRPSVFEISTYPSDLGIIIIVEDKTVEEETKRLSVIGATAGMVGHDIRNPLQAVLSDTYLLKEELTAMPECNSNEGVAESLDSIEKNIVYINKIVQDLQDFSRTISPEYSEVNLSNVFINIFKIVSLPDTIKLSINIKDSERLRTDPVLLQRALSNLVTNAIQAMPKGGSLEVGGQPKDNRIVITVKDSGTGIPDEIKPKLFAPMMTTKAKGQGFGLAVSKRLIEAMKGTITFESEKGKGTTFTISLPLAPSKLSHNR